ncbi:Hypothetical protein GbCGDNIH2_5080 [Granulibacter bethesdensis]|uniref:Uncharacterized protein n=2 Tax=Granulibacter bethesdensis TaxID=364410 RepID=A0A286M323_GRABC|nr:Hypothetical protein GbCGDNIH3_5080 [Granulibacter bethesdensis]AHJ66135.1 Hypothetical protein GbCGDNIH4_5080 [Granulibacter bethesdensis CGDNIH4]ASV62422.1 Hypothetical protein GbCGDNIH1_5080 [Granulibacter bethesdensis CGDNIH1]AHJ68785.1 Hypothetical protein GbCGDNIH2_5080 [Granulibacter bethesdensis]APH52130.1 Hypothetical protein GbCGDNIH5_5080 [Granulibacter bethesdensis]
MQPTSNPDSIKANIGVIGTAFLRHCCKTGMTASFLFACMKTCYPVSRSEATY